MDYNVIYTNYFNKQYKKAFKKHRCFEEDLRDITQTILANLEQTAHTNRIAGLSEKYALLPVHKINMMIKELRGRDARLIWHPNHNKKEILFIDVYLKSQQINHDVNIIKDSLDNYYSNRT